MKLTKKTNKYLKVFIILFVIGIFISFIYFNSLNNSDINRFINIIKNNRILFKVENNAIYHLKILSVITIFSILFIGIPIFIGLIIKEGFILFFRVILLYKIYKFKGVIYALLHYITGNLIYLILTYIIFKKIIIIGKKLYLYKFKNQNININEIYNLLLKCIYIIIIIFINDLLIYLYQSNIINILQKFCKL